MFKGEIELYIKAIGLQEGNNQILPLIGLLAENFELELFDFQDISNTYYKFLRSGVEFIFEEGYLTAIMFFVKPINDYSAYAKLDDLIYGLKSDMSKEGLMSQYGEPTEAGQGQYYWFKYKVLGKFVHFEFDLNGVFLKLTLLQN